MINWQGNEIKKHTEIKENVVLLSRPYMGKSNTLGEFEDREVAHI